MCQFIWQFLRKTYFSLLHMDREDSDPRLVLMARRLLGTNFNSCETAWQIWQVIR